MDLKRLIDVPPWEWPPETTREILATLRDEGASEDRRLLAARMGAELSVIDDDIAETLLAILDRGDFSDELRSQAALSLGPVLEQADVDGFHEPDDVPISAGMFRRINAALRKLQMDGGVPKVVRRRILEASVRTPQDWHVGAVRAAYASRDRGWKLTAVFAMRWVDGFENAILEALESDDDEIRHQAIFAAGNWGIEAAWPYVAPILEVRDVAKPMLLAAIEAAASIRPREAAAVLSDLTDDTDEEIAEAALDAISLVDI